MRFKTSIHYRYILFVIKTDLNPERDNVFGVKKIRTRLKLRASVIKEQLHRKKTTRQLTKFFILQNEPELERYGLY